MPDDVPGISYGTGRKGWMDKRVMALMLNEPRFVKRWADGRKRIIYLDNVNSHGLTPELEKLLEKLDVAIWYFLPNATHLVHAAL